MYMKNKEVLKYLNLARQYPKYYVGLIDQQLNSFVDQFNIKLGEDVLYETIEGKTLWEEAKTFLLNQQPLRPFDFHEGLAKAASDHSNDIVKNKSNGHTGSDGSTFIERIERYCKKGKGSMIELLGTTHKIAGKNSIQLGILNFIIDDGVTNRGHRRALFSKQYKYVGLQFCEYQDKIFSVVTITQANLQLLMNMYQSVGTSTTSINKKSEPSSQPSSQPKENNSTAQKQRRNSSAIQQQERKSSILQQQNSSVIQQECSTSILRRNSSVLRQQERKSSMIQYKECNSSQLQQQESNISLSQQQPVHSSILQQEKANSSFSSVLQQNQSEVSSLKSVKKESQKSVNRESEKLVKKQSEKSVRKQSEKLVKKQSEKSVRKQSEKSILNQSNFKIEADKGDGSWSFKLVDTNIKPSSNKDKTSQIKKQESSMVRQADQSAQSARSSKNTIRGSFVKPSFKKDSKQNSISDVEVTIKPQKQSPNSISNNSSSYQVKQSSRISFRASEEPINYKFVTTQGFGSTSESDNFKQKNKINSVFSKSNSSSIGYGCSTINKKIVQKKQKIRKWCEDEYIIKEVTTMIKFEDGTVQDFIEKHSILKDSTNSIHMHN